MAQRGDAASGPAPGPPMQRHCGLNRFPKRRAVSLPQPSPALVLSRLSLPSAPCPSPCLHHVGGG